MKKTSFTRRRRRSKEANSEEAPGRKRREHSPPSLIYCRHSHLASAEKNRERDRRRNFREKEERKKPASWLALAIPMVQKTGLPLKALQPSLDSSKFRGKKENSHLGIINVPLSFGLKRTWPLYEKKHAWRLRGPLMHCKTRLRKRLLRGPSELWLMGRLWCYCSGPRIRSAFRARHVTLTRGVSRGNLRNFLSVDVSLLCHVDALEPSIRGLARGGRRRRSSFVGIAIAAPEPSDEKKMGF